MRYTLLIVLSFVAQVLLAQDSFEQYMQDAYLLYKENEFTKAAPLIDKAVALQDGIKSKEAWHMRGFIYKDIYVHVDSGKLTSEARDTAIESLKKSMQLDSQGALHANNEKALRFLASTYFNDASEIIEMRDVQTLESANDQYLKYRSLLSFLYPDSALKQRDIEFYLAMSTAHRRIYESDRDKYEDHWNKSNDYLNRVLEIDPQNWPAFYSISVSHYNRGAYNLERLTDANISDIYAIQAESMRSIEIALPYMMKAYEINPDKIEAIKGLKVIYFNLHKIDESKKMEEIMQRLENDKK